MTNRRRLGAACIRCAEKKGTCLSARPLCLRSRSNTPSLPSLAAFQSNARSPATWTHARGAWRTTPPASGRQGTRTRPEYRTCTHARAGERRSTSAVASRAVLSPPTLPGCHGACSRVARVRCMPSADGQTADCVRCVRKGRACVPGACVTSQTRSARWCADALVSRVGCEQGTAASTAWTT
ncbi:hypothetical protein C8Q76DRAFT_741777 [Earliella scabrosa]|nr:hypothetical protein C8Q76DRAFT_741777 [Earliella scabrosa]